MASPTSDSESATAPPAWRCDHFALTLGADEVPEVLRRVASAIDRVEGFQLLNLVVNVCDEEATASVYYWRTSDRPTPAK